jgi:DNA-binding transcriptional LysR family regulator
MPGDLFLESIHPKKRLAIPGASGKVRTLIRAVMELYQLRTFLTVAEVGHLTRAAEKLFTSQPAVSAQIRTLEDELGVRLFERTPKGMILTSAGLALQEQARRIVQASREFKQFAETFRDHVSGQLVIGMNNRPEVLRLVEILQLLTRQHPDLCYELVGGSSGNIIQGMDDGAIAIGFFEGECTSARITYHHLDDIELCLVAPRTWEAELTRPDWKELEKKPWIFVSPMCSYFRTIENVCREQGLQLTPRFRVNEDITVLNLVSEGLGMTLTARNQVEMSGLSDRLFILPHYRASVPLCIGYQTARAHEPAIAAVCDVVLKVWQKLPASPAPKPKAARKTSKSKKAQRINLPVNKRPVNRN